MKLTRLLTALEEIAPLRLAADWDNVGLLVQPEKERPIRRVLLTIDLTEAVLAEARRLRVNLVVAYHPPIFKPLGRVTSASVAGRLVRSALGAGIAIYSPHTALDAVSGGVNDWLVSAFGKGTVRSLEPHLESEPSARYKLVTFLPEDAVPKLRDALAAAGVAGVIGEYEKCSYEIRGQGTFQGSVRSNPVVGQRGQFERVEEVRLEMVCAGGARLQRLEEVMRTVHPYETPAWDLYALSPKPRADVGQGRYVELARPLTLRTAVARIKAHLGLEQIRVATSPRHAAGEPVRSVAVCAGAGGSVLQGVGADLFLTGEMRHHDVLAANANGTSVALTDHSSSERGYLPILRDALRQRVPGLEVLLSKEDREPLRIV